jgi:diguanylate cyclase (GGDEF)-like protein
MVDVDFFKKINDSGGHQAGDLILKKLAGFFKESLRAEDLISRFGGDEFAFALSAWSGFLSSCSHIGHEDAVYLTVNTM